MSGGTSEARWAAEETRSWDGMVSDACWNAGAGTRRVTDRSDERAARVRAGSCAGIGIGMAFGRGWISSRGETAVGVTTDEATTGGEETRSWDGMVSDAC